MKHRRKFTSTPLFESLETRRLLSASSHMAGATLTLPKAASMSLRVRAAHVGPANANFVFLIADDVKTILAQAASQAGPGQVIAVADRDGNILGLLESPAAAGSVSPTQLTIREIKAIDEAVTAAFFASTQDAFSTRTARFIIQDHFPNPVANTPGGPLYGVQFSSLHGAVSDGLGFHSSDIYPMTIAGLSGDPGGIPLYINGVPVGGIGVAGDGGDIAARADVAIQGDTDASGKVSNGVEEHSGNEAVALAGARGFMAPASIRADKIFLEGLRFPFTLDKPATGKPSQTFDNLQSEGATILSYPDFFNGTIAGGHANFVDTSFNGVAGQLRFPITAGTAVGPGLPALSSAEVTQIIGQAVRRATKTRAAIREPVGVQARVFISVVDVQGKVLGVFGMQDTTNFSYDVAVQKARTSVLFSNATAAFSSRAVGFLAQKFFPIGINGGQTGPLFHLQNDLSGFNLVDPAAGTLGNLQPLKFGGVVSNGITIFPGGFPLYKEGHLVGGIGISGDGVDQDDLIGYTGTAGFRPTARIRSDHLGPVGIAQMVDSILPNLAVLGVHQQVLDQISAAVAKDSRHVKLPYVKLPRHADL